MLNFISECFNNDVQYQKGGKEKDKKAWIVLFSFNLFFTIDGLWIGGLIWEYLQAVGITNLAWLCLHFISAEILN